MKRSALAFLALLWASVAVSLLNGVTAEDSVPPPAYTSVPLDQADVPPAEWDQFLRENLERDLECWRANGSLSAADIPSVLEDTPQREQFIAVLRLVLVYNNRLYWPDREDPTSSAAPNPSSPLKTAFHHKVGALLQSGKLQLPNVLFMFNSDDNRPRFGAPYKHNRVPILSLIKTMGESDGDDQDILIPQMLWTHTSHHLMPWKDKVDLAFFRGTPYCSGYWNEKFNCSNPCPRSYLAWRSAQDQQLGRPRTLDVGIVQKFYGNTDQLGEPPQCVPNDLPVLPSVPIEDHTRYKWLLHLEGISASYRLSQLFTTNSLVLLQRSPWIEYFYRSLKPWVHYAPFWNTTASGMDDVYDVVAELRRRDAEDPASVQRMIGEAQLLASRFTSPGARSRYLKDALTAYKALFPDMDPFLEGYVAKLRARGFPIV